MSKIKDHLVRNKKMYLTGATCFLIGGIGTWLVVSKINVTQVAIGKDITQTVEIFVEALGDPGNIIQDTTTGIVYASQGQAARELGINASRISQHLHGKLDNVYGHTFKFLGKAAVA